MSDYCDVVNCWQKQICELHEYRFRWSPSSEKNDRRSLFFDEEEDDEAILVSHVEIDGMTMKFFVIPQKDFTWQFKSPFQTYVDTPEFKNWHYLNPRIIFHVYKIFKNREEEIQQNLNILPLAIFDLILSYSVEYKILNAISYLKNGTNRKTEYHSWSFIKFYASILDHLYDVHFLKVYALIQKKMHLIDFACLLADKKASSSSSLWIECLRFTDFLFDGRIWCY